MTVGTADAQTTSIPAPRTPAEVLRKDNLSRIDHIVVLYLENHSFDNLYGLFPGTENVDNAMLTEVQVNEKGVPYKYLPPILDNTKTPPAVDERFPEDLPDLPFIGNKYISLSDRTGDLVHRFYQQQDQIDGGRMDKFVLIGNSGALPMMYFDGSSLPLWQYAKRSMVADHFFHAAFGGSFLNHFWLVCACTPVFPNAPADLVAQLDPSGKMIKDGEVTPDGYAINTLQPGSYPHPAGIDPSHLLPLQTLPTIGDRLSEKGVSWAWYSGGYDDAIAGHPDPLFKFHHQPFLYFANFAANTQARADHLKDEADLLKAIDNDQLPSVVFWKPLGRNDEHPGYSDIASGDQHVASIIKRIENSSAWNSSLIIVTYDESGGYWDHVPPPVVDRWGPGVRVPTILISPYIKSGLVDHTVYDTTAILKLIESRYGIEPLGTRDAKQPSLINQVKFEGHFLLQQPVAPLPVAPQSK